ncbi:MAG TPA: serine/threonine-protein kinase [Actinomycetes bacterium]|nr:serine/threonine-protein kinase [Actinomycetes bacterium]
MAGRYTLISEIGRGGTGTVWRAADRAAGREVAVKVLHQRLGHHPQLVSGFVRQRTALTGIVHPHLVTVHDLVFDDGIIALVSELIEGQTLRQVLRRGLLPTPEAVTIGGQVASALARLHVAGVVHCDVKPENILLATTPDLGVDARLADLGTVAIAREICGGGDGPSDAGRSGTPGYLPPEASGLDPPTPAADVYALGVVLYELATGRGPTAINTRPGFRLRHVEPDAALAERFPHEEPTITVPPRIPEVPLTLWLTVGACLRADPTTRPMAARLAEQLGALGRNDKVPAVLPPDGVPPGAGDDQLRWSATPLEPDELPTPVQKPRPPEVAQAFAPEVRSRWMVGLAPVVACVLATILVTGVGAVLHRSWSSSAPPSGTTSTISAGHISATTSAERYFAPTGWICTASTAPTAAGNGWIDEERRNGALRLCFGIWAGMVHVSVHNAGAEPTVAPKVTTIPSTGASSLGRSGRSSLSQLSVLSAKVELRSIASTAGVTAITRVFRCDVSPHTGRNRCDMAPVAAQPGLTYTVAAYVLPSAGRPPSAASFPKTPTVLTPLIQNERSQDHGSLPKEPKES